MTSEPVLEFKVTGGAAAQTLALINALYVSRATGRDFKIRHYPHGTGTYWPMAIQFLLKDGELSEVNAAVRGMHTDKSLEVGKIIQDHPLQSKKFSLEVLWKIIRKARLEFVLRRLKNEIALEARFSRIHKIDKRIKRVSGGYVPLFNRDVLDELDKRFKMAKSQESPFSRDYIQSESYVAIHYRIGDMRTKFQTNFPNDVGVFDPECFKAILTDIGIPNTERIYVVSDEPRVAQGLLAQASIKANIFEGDSDIWRDLFRLSQAKIMIGSWSQVSHLAAICVANRGGHSYLPSSTERGKTVRWSLPKTVFFNPKYLDRNHPIYQTSNA